MAVPTNLPGLLDRLSVSIVTLSATGAAWFQTASIFRKGRWQAGLRFAVFSLFV